MNDRNTTEATDHPVSLSDWLRYMARNGVRSQDDDDRLLQAADALDAKDAMEARLRESLGQFAAAIARIEALPYENDGLRRMVDLDEIRAALKGDNA